MFTKPKYTNAGKELQARALSGACKIIFTSVGLGAGELTTQAIAALTDLIQPVKRIDIQTIDKISTDTVQMKAILRNIELTTGFFWREFGLYAQDPDNPDDRTKDILFCYQNAGDLAEYIPTAKEQLLDRVIYLGVTTGDANQVDINFKQEIFCLEEDFLEHCADPSAHDNLTHYTDPEAHANLAHYTDQNAHSEVFNKYAKDANVVHKSGNEAISGVKTFSSNIVGNLTGNSDTATKATQDSDGNQINTTYLPLAGGKMTGTYIARSVNNSLMAIIGGQDANSGASFMAYGKNSSSGSFLARAHNGSSSVDLIGQANGALTWKNKNIVRSVNNIYADSNGNIDISEITGNVKTVNGTMADANGNVNITHVSSADTATNATNAVNCPNYLPLAGGQMTGFFIGRNTDDSFLHLSGCTDYIKGSMLVLYGEGSSDFTGSFRLIARNSSTSYELVGNLNGELFWGGKHIVRSVNDTFADQNGNVHISSVQTSNELNSIIFDWGSQVSGFVGIKVDNTNMGGIVTTNNLPRSLGGIGVYDIGSTIHACTGMQVEYGATVAGSALKYAATDAGGGIYDLNHQLTTVGTWLKVSGNSRNTGGFGLYRRIA